jgi:uncharacterized RDD family membrane protein YckC
LTYIAVPAGRTVALEHAHAGWWRRFAAQLVDGVVVTIGVFAALVLLVVVAEESGADESIDGLFIVLLLVAWAAYWVLGWGGHSGQTPGKRALSVAVRRTDGSPLGYGRALWRLVVMEVLWIFVPLGLLAALWPLWDGRRQTWWDKAAGSVVVHTPAVRAAPPQPVPLAGERRPSAASSRLAPRRPERPASSWLDEATRTRYESGEISPEEYDRLQAFHDRIRREAGR